VLWEIFSKGSEPYGDLANEQVLERVVMGYRLPCPQDAPLWAYNIMCMCWSAERPTFDSMRNLLSFYVAHGEDHSQHSTPALKPQTGRQNQSNDSGVKTLDHLQRTSDGSTNNVAEALSKPTHDFVLAGTRRTSLIPVVLVDSAGSESLLLPDAPSRPELIPVAQDMTVHEHSRYQKLLVSRQVSHLSSSTSPTHSAAISAASSRQSSNVSGMKSSEYTVALLSPSSQLACLVTPALPAPSPSAESQPHSDDTPNEGSIESSI
jgi:hypothetical protein